jgi:hypothetical protein
MAPWEADRHHATGDLAGAVRTLLSLTLTPDAPAAPSARGSKLVLLDGGELHQVTLQPFLERGAAMDRHGQADAQAGLAVDVVTALHPQKLPAAPLDQPTKRLAGKELFKLAEVKR